MKFILTQEHGDGGKGYTWSYSGDPGLGSIHVINLAGHIHTASCARDAILKILDEVGQRDPRMRGSSLRGPKDD